MQTVSSLSARLRNSILSQLAGLPIRREYLSTCAAKFFNSYNSNQTEAGLHRAIQDYLSGAICKDAEKYFNHIESYRQQLLKDNSVINRKDFGAGETKQFNQANKNITTVSKLCKGSSMPGSLGVFLFSIIKNCRTNTALEMGTCLGISGAYQAMAMKLNNTGKLFTIEGDPETAKFAARTFSALELDNVIVSTGKFSDVLLPLLQTLGSLDFVLIDGHHNGEATLQYFAMLKPYLTDDAIIVFDDIDWSADMQYAWKLLKQNSQLHLTIDFGRTGIAIFSKSEVKQRRHLRLRI